MDRTMAKMIWRPMLKKRVDDNKDRWVLDCECVVDDDDREDGKYGGIQRGGIRRVYKLVPDEAL